MLASSRSDGNTRLALDILREGYESEFVDLLQKRVATYDYNYGNRDDDFLPLARLLNQHDPIVFATPIYWYTMSAQLKVFLDRATDLLRYREEREYGKLGHGLVGRKVFLLSTGAEEEIPPAFEEPFRLTFEYLEMQWCGNLYVPFLEDAIVSDFERARIREFAQRIFVAT